MSPSPHVGPATRAIHGQRHRDAFGSPHMPIYDTTTFAYPDTAVLLEVVEGRRQGPLYTRYGQNPTLYALEETLGIPAHCLDGHDVEALERQHLRHADQSATVGAGSLVTQPCTTSHADLTPTERARRGIGDGLSMSRTTNDTS